MQAPVPSGMGAFCCQNPGYEEPDWNSPTEIGVLEMSGRRGASKVGRPKSPRRQKGWCSVASRHIKRQAL